MWKDALFAASRKVVLSGMEAVARARTTDRVRQRNVLITAIPRSGSSFFVTLLNQVPNCVAANEVTPTRYVFHFFRAMRKKIERGQVIPNKYTASGEFTTDTIDDTSHLEEREVEVENNDFVLAHKYTTPYLNRLEHLVGGGWEVWALVRHPLYTLASWKRCPPHFTIAQLNPPHRSLAHINFSSEDLDVRRVEVWNHYAGRIHALREKLHVVRYEDLTANVEATIGRFCERYGLRVPRLPPAESRNRSDAYTGLTAHLRELVNERCELWRFGYQVAG